MRHHNSPDSLFSADIETDDWVLFHGTSSSGAAAIEKHGLHPHAGAATKETVDRVLAVVSAIDWISPAASSLMSYSQGFDLAHGGSPLFLAESSLRAARYASDDFAGGEKLSRIRKTIDDLARFLEDEDLRDQHYASKVRTYEKYQRVMHPDQLESLRPKIVDLGWLSAQLAALEDIRIIADEARVRHSNGVVFAFRFDADDVKHMVRHQSMGIMTMRPIPPTKIIASTSVPKDFDCGPRNDRYRLLFLDKAIASALKPWTIEWREH
ncbi:hypothetical protein [Erythrobacter aurantius]|uniref:hypothetical protein n=1 Tax=Erythrobacter aurantius TaxID=2909249 RepID=UPI0020792FE1|nr:hypothetical protein [Erythrobacter aurantius]